MHRRRTGRRCSTGTSSQDRRHRGQQTPRPHLSSRAKKHQQHNHTHKARAQQDSRCPHHHNRKTHTISPWRRNSRSNHTRSCMLCRTFPASGSRYTRPHKRTNKQPTSRQRQHTPTTTQHRECRRVPRGTCTRMIYTPMYGPCTSTTRPPECSSSRSQGDRTAASNPTRGSNSTHCRTRQRQARGGNQKTTIPKATTPTTRHRRSLPRLNQPPHKHTANPHHNRPPRLNATTHGPPQQAHCTQNQTPSKRSSSSGSHRPTPKQAQRNTSQTTNKTQTHGSRNTGQGAGHTMPGMTGAKQETATQALAQANPHRPHKPTTTRHLQTPTSHGTPRHTQTNSNSSQQPQQQPRAQLPQPPTTRREYGNGHTPINKGNTNNNSHSKQRRTQHNQRRPLQPPTPTNSNRTTHGGGTIGKRGGENGETMKSNRPPPPPPPPQPGRPTQPAPVRPPPQPPLATPPTQPPPPRRPPTQVPHTTLTHPP